MGMSEIPMSYPDESAKTGVWRVMPVDEFSAWLSAQSNVPTSIRYIVDHHTWSPESASQSPSGFLAQVMRIFRNYYEKPKSKGGRGWPRDHGPHLHLGIIDGKAWLVIAANLWVHGPHCAYFNSCSVGIETYTNGDKAQWSDEMMRGLYVVHAALRDRLGIPLKLGVSGPVNTNIPAENGTGYLFHRDAKDADKSCPGTKNTHALLQAALDRYDTEGDTMSQEQFDRLMNSLQAQSYRSSITNARAIGDDAKAAKLNTEFYAKWPEGETGLPKDWAPPK